MGLGPGNRSMDAQFQCPSPMLLGVQACRALRGWQSISDLQSSPKWRICGGSPGRAGDSHHPVQRRDDQLLRQLRHAPTDHRQRPTKRFPPSRRFGHAYGRLRYPVATDPGDLLPTCHPVRSELRNHRHFASTLHLLSIPSPASPAGGSNAPRGSVCPSLQPMACNQPTRLLPDRSHKCLCDEPCAHRRTNQPKHSAGGAGLSAGAIPTGQRYDPRNRGCPSQRHKFAFCEF